VSIELRAAIGDYPSMQALKSGRVRSDLLTLDFAAMPAINRAFAPMVREQKFDVCEIAIATFFQAKAYGKPLVLLPVVTLARFQQSALLCRVAGDIGAPADLAGRRIGVRAYSQTTGVWLRGILADEYGVRPQDMDWTTFEGAHVAEYRDPPFVRRAGEGKEMLAMLRDGELDAIIVGNELPSDPRLRPVFADPDASAQAFWRKRHFVPINHMICVRAELAENGRAIAELLRMFAEAGSLAPAPKVGAEPYPASRAALAPALRLALRYANEQGLLARPLSVDDLWEGSPAS
jgi:4,5-dihydroxyphthalate decarboxylase